MPLPWQRSEESELSVGQGHCIHEPGHLTVDAGFLGYLGPGPLDVDGRVLGPPAWFTACGWRVEIQCGGFLRVPDMLRFHSG